MQSEIYLVTAAAIFTAGCALLAAVHRKKTSGEDEQRRLETLERSLYEALRDLRGEQNALARAARIENQAAADRLSEQFDNRVARLADLTGQSLEQIRTVVDEKLDVTIDRKFAAVNTRLEEVHRGLGKMQSLAGCVDELRRILTNVKTRGTWGEMQLGNVLREVLSPGRFAENVEVRPRSGLRVEFALRLPGQDEEIWLPIDAKFPQEDYQRLQQAREQGDAEGAAAALKQLERRLKSEAKDIREKYICPPYSTDFAIMYLPSESLFVEALGIPGFLDEAQRVYRVCVAGPTTLAALLNSLQMGFRTLAVQRRTDEVWRLLAAVKQDMRLLEASLAKTQKKLDETTANMEAAHKRVKILGSRLEAIETLDFNTKEAGGDETK